MPKTKHKQHGEVRKSAGIAVTPTALKGLDVQAELLGISRSDLVERIGRGEIPLGSYEQLQAILGECLPS